MQLSCSYQLCPCSYLCYSPVSGLLGLENFQKPKENCHYASLCRRSFDEFLLASFDFEVVYSSVVILTKRILVEGLGQSKMETEKAVKLGNSIYYPLNVGRQLCGAKPSSPYEFVDG